ncbi:MAG: membrane protein insertion efficiency factor YidD [Candidatus Melainabacteria bacterium]
MASLTIHNSAQPAAGSNGGPRFGGHNHNTLKRPLKFVDPPDAFIYRAEPQYTKSQNLSRRMIMWYRRRNMVGKLFQKTGVQLCIYDANNAKHPPNPAAIKLMTPAERKAGMTSMSCSRITLRAVEEYGTAKGIWVGMKQLLKCNSLGQLWLLIRSRLSDKPVEALAQSALKVV